MMACYYEGAFLQAVGQNQACACVLRHLMPGKRDIY